MKNALFIAVFFTLSLSANTGIAAEIETTEYCYDSNSRGPLFDTSIPVYVGTLFGIAVTSVVAAGTSWPIASNLGIIPFLAIVPAITIVLTTLTTTMITLFYNDYPRSAFFAAIIGVSSAIGTLAGGGLGFYLGKGSIVFIYYLPLFGQLLGNTIFTTVGTIFGAELLFDKYSPIYLRKECSQ